MQSSKYSGRKTERDIQLIPQLGCGNSTCWMGHQTGIGAMTFVQGITVSRAGDFSKHLEEPPTHGMGQSVKARQKQTETKVLTGNLIYTHKC